MTTSTTKSIALPPSPGSHRQLKDSSRVDMRDVTLKLFAKDCKSYNLVKTAEASYFSNEHRFVSEGQVQITLKAPMPGQPAPSTRLPDLQGLTLDLAEYKGRVVLLEFWSFDWPAFLETIPARAELDCGAPLPAVAVR